MILSFLGRNTEGILADAHREFPSEQGVLVISRDGDQLQPPAGVEVVSVSAFVPVASESYTLIANGGTSSQLLPVVKRRGGSNVHGLGPPAGGQNPSVVEIPP